MSLAPVGEIALPRLAGSVEGLREAAEAGKGASPSQADATSDVGFADVLARMVTQANAADQVASRKVDALASGLSDDLHGTMISVKEADISIKLVASIRNKLLDAFNDIWKTSV